MRCDVCAHPARAALEAKIREGMSLELLGQRYGLNDDVLRRHRNEHAKLSVPAVNTPTVVHSRMDPAALFEEHNDCIRECLDLVAFSKSQQDTKGWAMGIREWRCTLEQKNKMLGLYDQVDPRLQHAFASRVIEVVSRALEKHPEARQEVLLAIDQIEGNKHE